MVWLNRLEWSLLTDISPLVIGFVDKLTAYPSRSPNTALLTAPSLALK